MLEAGEVRTGAEAATEAVSMPSAAAHGLALCEACGLLSRMPVWARGVATGKTATTRRLGTFERDIRCPRCHAPLHLRKPASVSRTWALVIAAFILYIPANVLPILYTTQLFETQSNTIASGVLLFWRDGSWFIAALIFVASILVPLTKLIALCWLLISVQRGERGQQAQRTRLFRFVELIGRWSMLDIYVVALSVALVQLESFASMQAGLGAACFGAVVVLTMLAAHSFDPRLIWDSRESPHA